MKIETSKKVPAGVMFIDWRDSSGKIWKDSIPEILFNNFVSNLNITILKVVRGAKE